MDNYSEITEEREVPKCKLKVSSWPKYEGFNNAMPYESKEELHRILPSPIIKWSDYYQTLPDAALEARRDFYWMKKLNEKAEKIKERRLADGKEQ